MENGDSDAMRVLVISSSVDGAKNMATAAAAQEGVLTFVYDGENDTLDSILTGIQTVLDGRDADSIAFATHDLGEARFHLVGSHSVSPG